MNDNKVEQVQEYKQMLDEGLINQEEFSSLKSELLHKTYPNAVNTVSTHMHTPNSRTQTSNEHSSQNNTEDDATILKVLGFLSAGLSLFFIPILFSTLGVVFGALVNQRTNRYSVGTIIIILSIGAGLFGLLLGYIVGYNAY